MDNSTPHKRRPHYKGTHPRNFNEKYKEHNPEKYAETIEKVKAKGSTPAGMHISIMVDEILSFLDIKPGQIGLDATLGYGGHTRKMLEKLKYAVPANCKDRGQAPVSKPEHPTFNGHIHALDVDPIESEKTKKRLADAGFGKDILTVHLMNFADIDKLSEEVGNFDFVLADLGVSSMQIDDPSRGFSYKTDGPLDLRLNPTAGTSAAQRLHELSREEMIGMFTENSDEPFAVEIADAILNEYKRGNDIATTKELAAVIEKALIRKVKKAELKDAVKKSCARVFQALRIDVNSEFEVLYAFLDKLPDIMNPGGRIAILTFHSGEDRLVKKSFKENYKTGIYSEISTDVIRPSREECLRNPRAHSTKMRWAVKCSD